MAISLERTYRRIPAKELKRRARAGDEMANMLYRAVSYGSSLKVVLWTLIAVTNAIFFIVLTKTSPLWFAVVGIIAVIWFGFLWLPARDVTKYGSWVATKLAPVFGWILEYIHPIVNRIGQYIEKHRPLSVHTGLYDKEDLIELIDKQKVQIENRIDKAELEIVKHVLEFGDKTVADYQVPRRTVKSVSADDSIGPVLMGELHKSGHSRFPVYEDKKDNIVGMLYLHDVIGKEDNGKVKNLLRKDVVYIHEEQPLFDVLQAAIKMHRHLFIVVNSFEEYTGIISVEDVLEQIIGLPIIDEFDQYDDLRAVAAKMAKAEHQEHQKSEVSTVTEESAIDPKAEEDSTDEEKHLETDKK